MYVRLTPPTSIVRVVSPATSVADAGHVVGVGVPPEPLVPPVIGFPPELMEPPDPLVPPLVADPDPDMPAMLRGTPPEPWTAPPAPDMDPPLAGGVPVSSGRPPPVPSDPHPQRTAARRIKIDPTFMVIRPGAFRP